MYGGFRHCIMYKVNNSIICSDNSCTLTIMDPDLDTVVTKFSAEDLKGAEMVRILKGEIQTGPVEKTRGSLDLGYSVKLTYKMPTDESSRLKIQKDSLFSKTTLGRRVTKNHVSTITKFITDTKDKKKGKELNISVGRSFTTNGLAMILVGLMTLVVGLLAGQFSDQSAKQLRKTK